jgi:uncharacterized protein YjaZ
MSINIHFMDASRRLAPYRDEIVSETENIIKKVKVVLSLPHVDIIICDNPDRSIPEIGIGGETMTPNLILIYLDPLFSELKESIENEIKSTIAHELFHSARQKVLGHDKTLLEALISEGLADNFDIEVTCANAHPWSMALDQQQLIELEMRAQEEYSNKEYSHSEWFFGSKEKKIPRWTGYSLGFKLVSNYLSKTQKNASDFYKLSAKTFIQ